MRVLSTLGSGLTLTISEISITTEVEMVWCTLHSPYNLILGDFNFPDISWSDSTGTVNSSLAYGYEVNQMFLDIIHDHGLGQLVTEATLGNNILDLILCSHPYIISDTNIIPGISDREALLFCLGSLTKPVIDEINRSIFLFHKGNMASLKGDIFVINLCDYIYT